MRLTDHQLSYIKSEAFEAPVLGAEMLHLLVSVARPLHPSCCANRGYKHTLCFRLQTPFVRGRQLGSFILIEFQSM